MNAILYNGKIYPQHPVKIRPTCLVIKGNRIMVLGHDFAKIKREFSRFKCINLKGRAVIPGLVDAHTHFYFWAINLDTVHLDRVTTFDDALKQIKAAADKVGPGHWITGDGWSADRWHPKYLPNSKDLDAVTGQNPAALLSKDHHMIWANTRALEMAGIDKNTPQPDGGQIDVDSASGRPTGILRELPAYQRVLDLMKKPPVEHVHEAWKRASRIAHSRGVTGFHSVDRDDAWDYFETLNRENRLKFRVHYYFPDDRLDYLIENGYVTGQGDDNLQVGGVKIYADGALGSQTALMKKPYNGSADNYGVAVMPPDELNRLVKKASDNNLACAIHAIGDRAVSDVIGAFERGGGNKLRHRIEHLQCIERSDIQRLRKTHAIASMQPSHCPSDRQIVASYWGIRGKNAYVFKTLIENDIPLAFGSDCPIEPLHPIEGIHAAVNRTGYGEKGGKFYPEQCLTPAQAVFGFTAGPAYAAGRENFSGGLLPGYQADVVILEDNIFEMPKSQIYAARVSATIYDGQFVYRNKESRLFT